MSKKVKAHIKKDKPLKLKGELDELLKAAMKSPKKKKEKK